MLLCFFPLFASSSASSQGALLRVLVTLGYVPAAPFGRIVHNYCASYFFVYYYKLMNKIKTLLYSTSKFRTCFLSSRSYPHGCSFCSRRTLSPHQAR